MEAMKHLKVEEEDGGSDQGSKVEEVVEEMDEGDRSNVLGSTGEGFSLTMDGMSNSLAMSFQWLDKVHSISTNIYSLTRSDPDKS